MAQLFSELLDEGKGIGEKDVTDFSNAGFGYVASNKNK